MTDNVFDAAGYIRVNLEDGVIQSKAGTPLALLPVDFFDVIEPTRKWLGAARAFGERKGKEFLNSGDVATKSLGCLAGYLQGEIALLGLGNASIDVCGDAVMIKVLGEFTGKPAVIALLEGFVSGYLGAVSNLEFQSVSSVQKFGGLRIFVGNPQAVVRMKEILTGDVSFLDAVTQLHEEVA